MVIDRKVVLTGLMNWTASAARKFRGSQPDKLGGGRRRLYCPLAKSARGLDAVRPARSLVPQPRCGRAQIGIAAEMKPDHDNRLEARGDVSGPGECSRERLRAPEVVGQVNNPVLETIRRLWWRAFDRVCYSIVLIRCGSSTAFMDRNRRHPPTLNARPITSGWPRLFPMTGETIEPTKCRAGQNRAAR